jgi:hypothetical protein
MSGSGFGFHLRPTADADAEKNISPRESAARKRF